MRQWIDRLTPAIALAAMLIALIGGLPTARAEEHATVLQRIVHRFDFEERKLGNFEPMPMHWFKVSAPGFPRYTDVGFDDTVAHSANHSLKLQLDGGSAAVTLEPGVLPSVPQARYEVTAEVRTAQVDHSAARVIAMFVDQHLHPLADTRRMSDPIRSNGQWTRVSVELPDAPDDAAWIVLRLELVQSEQLNTAHLGVHKIMEQDIRAAAWFDDVTVSQLPLIDLETQTPLNVVRMPDSPQLSARVHDVTGAKLTAKVEVFDAAGRCVDQDQRPLDAEHPGQWNWRPKLPGLGWYRAELTVTTGSDTVARTALAMSWLPAATIGSQAQAGRFVISAERMNDAQRQLLPQMMQLVGPQRVLMSVWRSAMTHDQLVLSMDEPDATMMQLLRQQQPVTLSFSQIPMELAEASQTDPDRPLAMFAGKDQTWKPYVQAVLARYGQRVGRWQVGPTDSTEGFDRSDLATLYPRIQALFRQYIPDAQVLLPWKATRQMTAGDAGAVSGYMMTLPTSIRPQTIAGYVKSWSVKPSEMVYHLDTLNTDQYSADDRCTDLALRMIDAWRCQPAAMAIDIPWGGRMDRAHGATLQPSPLLDVWVNVSEQLSGRHFVGEMDLGPGIRCDMFDSPGDSSGGVLVAWNKTSPTAAADLDLYLGDHPTAIDIFGNRHPLSPNGNKQQLKLTQQPTFITGVDMRLARFRAGFHIDPAFASSVHTVHEHTLMIANPWPRTITGHVRILSPNDWDYQPRISDFTIPAGQTYQMPMSITFPINELAGSKLIRARVSIEADRRYELDLAAPMRIGLKDVDFKANLSVRRAPETPDASPEGDLVITLMVTNLGDKDQSFYAFALPPGLPRQQRIISPLQAGQTLVRRFYLRGAGDKLTGKKVRVGLRQTDGPAVLNQMLDVP